MIKKTYIQLHVLDRDAFQHIAKVTHSGSDTYIKTYLSVKINKLNKENKEKNIIMQSLRNSSFNGSKSNCVCNGGAGMNSCRSCWSWAHVA